MAKVRGRALCRANRNEVPFFASRFLELKEQVFRADNTIVVTHAYTLVFTRELPDSRVVRQTKRTLRELFETDEVTTSDRRKFSFVTTIREEKMEAAVDLFGREQKRKFVRVGGTIHEINYQEPNMETATDAKC